MQYHRTNSGLIFNASIVRAITAVLMVIVNIETGIQSCGLELNGNHDHSKNGYLNTCTIREDVGLRLLKK